MKVLFLPAQIYTVVALALFLSAGDLALGRLGMAPFRPSTGAFSLLFPLVVFALARDMLSRRSRGRILAVLERNAAPICAFTVLTMLSLALANHRGAYWGEDGKWIYLIVFGYVLFLLSLFLPLYKFIRRWFRTITALAAAALFISIATDVVNPGFFSSLPGRAAGFPGNSNFGALVLTMLCAASLGYDPRRGRGWDLTLLTMTGLGVFATLSRSGLLEFGVLAVFYFWAAYLRTGIAVRRALSLLAVFIVLAAVFALAIPFIIENTAMFSEHRTRVARLSSHMSIDDGSAESRMAAAALAFNLISESPLIGHGTAHSRTLPELPHNLYLQQWLNNGVLGLLSYMALLGSSWRVFARREFHQGTAFVLVTAVGSLFSHNVLDQRCFLLGLGMLLAISALVRESAVVRYSPAARSPLSRNPARADLALHSP